MLAFSNPHLKVETSAFTCRKLITQKVKQQLCTVRSSRFRELVYMLTPVCVSDFELPPPRD